MTNTTIRNDNTITVPCDSSSYGPEQFIIRAPLMVPVIVFGIVTNVVNIYIFARREMRQSLLNWFILAICATDVLILCSSFFMFSLPAIAEWSELLWVYGLSAVCMRWTYAFAIMSQCANIYFTVLASLHRFLGVCYPFKAQRWLDKRSITIAIVLTIVFSALTNLPRFMEVSIAKCVAGNSTSFVIRPTILLQNQFYFLAYRTIAYSIIMFLIPFALLIYVNLRIIGTVWRSTENRRRMQTGQSTMAQICANGKPCTLSVDQPPNSINMSTLNKPRASILCASGALRDMSSKRCSTTTTTSALRSKERSTTTMLLVIVAVFLACNLLALIMNIVDYVAMIWPSIMLWRHFGRIYSVLVDFGNLMVALNSAAMILIYYFFGSKYKSIFDAMLRCDTHALDEKEMRRAATIRCSTYRDSTSASARPGLTIKNAHAEKSSAPDYNAVAVNGQATSHYRLLPESSQLAKDATRRPSAGCVELSTLPQNDVDETYPTPTNEHSLLITNNALVIKHAQSTQLL